MEPPEHGWALSIGRKTTVVPFLVEVSDSPVLTLLRSEGKVAWLNVEAAVVG
jgi:hypothetical protein